MKRITVIIVLVLGLLTAAFGKARSASGEGRVRQKAPPGVSIDPTSIDFPDQVTRRASAPRRITVTNTGEKKLYINSAALGGDDVQDFILSSDTCTGASIAAQKSCIIDIRFNPRRTGSKKATLTLTDNAGDSPQRVILSGNGINSVDEPQRASSAR